MLVLGAPHGEEIHLVLTIGAEGVVLAPAVSARVVDDTAVFQLPRLDLNTDKPCARINDEVICRAAAEREADEESGADLAGEHHGLRRIALVEREPGEAFFPVHRHLRCGVTCQSFRPFAIIAASGPVAQRIERRPPKA